MCCGTATPWWNLFLGHIGRLRESGTDEFVLYWPQSWRQKSSELQVFEEVANTVMPAIRATG
ncbi:MAG TPA: hypothetical protein VKE25_11325 [Actinomycetes bacterium]|nr:hypothetical protein [Actinomycetes bacterium]